MTLKAPPRLLPMLEVAPPVVAPSGPRDPFAPEDERLEEFRPGSPALPRFFVWTLGCQMNKSDSEEMAGRLLAAGCAEASSMDVADLVVITCAIREARGGGRRGHLRQAQGREPRDAGRPHRVCRSRAIGPDWDASTRRSTCSCAPTRSRAGRSARARVGAGRGGRPGSRMGADAATTIVNRVAVSDASHLAGSCCGRRPRRGRSPPAISAWLPIVYGCDKTCTYCIVPFSRGPERSRPFDEILQ